MTTTDALDKITPLDTKNGEEVCPGELTFGFPVPFTKLVMLLLMVNINLENISLYKNNASYSCYEKCVYREAVAIVPHFPQSMKQNNMDKCWDRALIWVLCMIIQNSF